MSLFRPDIDRIEGYIPGEQPQEAGWIKLNTNENPYPPSPRAIEAIEAAARAGLNKYPDPLGTKFRQTAAPVPNGEIIAHGFFALDALPNDTTAATRARIIEVLGDAPVSERW